MIRLTTLLFALSFSMIGLAQISIEKDTVHHYFKDSGLSESKAVISTSSSTPLKVAYEIILDEVGPTWKANPADASVQFCDCNTCNVDYPLTDSCDFDLSDGSPYLFVLYVDPKGNKDVKYFTVVIWDQNNPASRDTLTWVTDTTKILSTPEIALSKNSDIKISPNPTNGITNVSLSGVSQGLVEIDVVNLLGNVVYRMEQQVDMNSAEFELNLTELNRGIYFIRVSDGIQTLTKKVSVK